MIKRLAIIGIFSVLSFSLVLITPGSSKAQFCRDEIACSKVYSLGPVSDLVLCQFVRPAADIPRGLVDYVFCQSSGDPKTWNCDRKMPRGLSMVTLTESEWNNDFLRCAKICGECSRGWESGGLR